MCCLCSALCQSAVSLAECDASLARCLCVGSLRKLTSSDGAEAFKPSALLQDATTKEIEEVLVKAVRLVANLAINQDVGAAAADTRILSLLVKILGALTAP